MMTSLQKTLSISLVVSLSGMTMSCEQIQRMIENREQNGPSNGATEELSQKIIKSKDGGVEISIPGNWGQETTLHDTADIQASHPISESYLLVFIESKVDFDENLGLEGYSQITRQGMHEKLKNSKETGPIKLTVDQKPAIQYILEGTYDFTKIVYLHTAIESPTHFYQVLLWTTPSRLETHRPTFDKIVQQFHEVTTAQSGQSK